MFKIGVLVSGNGTNLQAIIDNINNNTIKNSIIKVVISNKENAYALTRAKINNINTKCIQINDFENKQDFENFLITYLDKMNLDLIVLSGFMVILSENFINKFANKIINIHPSLIPSFAGNGYYGLKVHKAVIERGVKLTGATVHFVTKDADEGPIIIQKCIDVFDDDTPEILQKRVLENVEWKILSQAINLIKDKKIYIKNNCVKNF